VNKQKHKGNTGATGSGTGSAGATGSGTGTAGATGSGTGSTGTTATSPSGAGTGTGFSEIDLQAAEADTLTKANTPATANSVGLDIEANDVGYVSTIQLGSPPTAFNVIMDSGSADFWVAGDNCKTCV
jgi:hypothetical protein